ncbi:DUF2334 domain-containing protein [Acetobacterium sp.]|uniref:DUF2334 domain-containing protein n=1 Tax=Acetobacterium sp. TaxID=1872094 RepID=UPI000CB4E200|nr:DUF2334 domain-containing protein [Acetobacterium sp.]MDO9491722.1 DUF2334 domain-containing protein [Acetobacterium sp.]PKM73697.1 MAG: hypothetical protein CVU92_06295 [Firmicutes bacterium HGW-Firmicutes-17]
MKQSILILIVLALLVLPMSIIYGEDAGDKETISTTTEVLLIYDQLAADTVYRDNLNTVETLLSALSRTAERSSIDDYRAGQMSGYQKVIILKNTENAINNPAFIADCQNYSGALLYIGFVAPGLIPSLDSVPISRQMGRTVSVNMNGLAGNSIWIDDLRVVDERPGPGETTIGVGTSAYPFSKTLDRLTYVPTLISDPGFALGLGEILKDWFGLATAAHMTLLIPDIYPFSDLNMVIETSNAFYASGIPFALGVVPIDDNMDFPAMARFYQVLRYVQSRNGTIIVHRPSPVTVSDGNAVLSEKMYAVITKMVENGVYPLGLATGESLFFDKVSNVSPLNLFSSGVILPDPGITEPGSKETWALSSASLGISLETIERTSSQNRNFGNYPINTTIVMPLPENEAALAAQLGVINNKWLSLTDYKRLNNYWTIGQNTITSSASGIRVNGLPVSLSYDEEPIEADYRYQKPPEYSLEKIFTAGNTFLLTVVGIIIVLFIVIVVFSRRVYLNKFRKIAHNEEKNEPVKTSPEQEDNTP